MGKRGVFRGRKREVEALLRAADWEGLQRRVEADPAYLGALFRALHLSDALLAWRAVEGLGRALALVAEKDKECALDRMRRLFWALNDESGNAGRYLAPAVGEAVARAPEVFSDFALMLLNPLEEPFLAAGAAWALGRIAEVRKDLVLETAPRLLELLRSPDPETRGYAAWALGNLRWRQALPELEQLQADLSPLFFYREGELQPTTVGELAALARRRLTEA
ncbi:DVU0298 family protein [Desulfothermobacter acidiphilus]|uniref:DVU0298 family protein n=1 Tax=Desulfothermobacter acidiphilus TaxID=1938353 RepID=UPI003F8A1AD5